MVLTGKEPVITADKLRDILSYDPKSGIWVWRKKNARKVIVGKIAGFLHSSGYWKINIDGKAYYASRLAWLYVTGELPNGIVDHINLDKSDNRWCNLRLATKSQNGANSRAQNAFGLKGVYQITGRRNFFSSIKINGENKRLGNFDCPAAAHFAYALAAYKYFGNFARTV